MWILLFLLFCVSFFHPINGGHHAYARMPFDRNGTVFCIHILFCKSWRKYRHRIVEQRSLLIEQLWSSELTIGALQDRAYTSDVASMPSQSACNFDIDHYLDRFIPPNRLDVLPAPITRFLGHRQHPEQQKPVGNVLVWFWACLGAFCGILVVEAVYSTPLLRGSGAPIVIGSLVCLFPIH